MGDVSGNNKYSFLSIIYGNNNMKRLSFGISKEQIAWVWISLGVGFDDFSVAYRLLYILPADTSLKNSAQSVLTPDDASILKIFYYAIKHMKAIDLVAKRR